jgi:N-acetylmuramoyl-L-alanine amidase
MSNLLGPVELAYRWLTAPKRQLSPWELRPARKFRRQCADWMRAAQVTGYGCGNKNPRTGAPGCSPALLVHVPSKLPFARVPALVPAVLTLPELGFRIATDVVEVPMPSPACRPGEWLSRSQLGNPGGTATCAVYSQKRPDRKYLLSCWHVMCGVPGRAGDPIFIDRVQVARLSGKYQALSFDPAPQLDRVQSFDGALAEVQACVPQPLNPTLNLRIQGVRTTLLQPGELITSFGSNSGRPRTARVIASQATRSLHYGGERYLTFANLIHATGFSRKGDSGAPVLDSQDLLVGYVIGDDAATDLDNAGNSWVQPIAPVLAEYAVDLVRDASSAAAALGDISAQVHVDVLARTLWGEARGEPVAGRLAVAWVVLNRVARNSAKRFGATIAEVCRKPFQFSCWNASDPNRAKIERVDVDDPVFRDCLELARQVVNGSLAADPTAGSDHYHANGVQPNWAKGHAPIRTIGRHRFYNDIP